MVSVCGYFACRFVNKCAVKELLALILAASFPVARGERVSENENIIIIANCVGPAPSRLRVRDKIRIRWSLVGIHFWARTDPRRAARGGRLAETSAGSAQIGSSSAVTKRALAIKQTKQLEQLLIVLARQARAQLGLEVAARGLLQRSIQAY